jgi:hypothetical protein
VLRSFVNALQIPSLITAHTRNLEGYEFSLARNCVLFAIYLGLSATTVPGKQETGDGQAQTHYETQFEEHRFAFPADRALDNSNTENTQHAYPQAEISSSESNSPFGSNPTPQNIATVPTPSPSLAETPGRSSASDGLGCLRCQRPFSTRTNLNRHVLTHCPMLLATAGFPCRNLGCGKISKREDNRNRHEKIHCRFRRQ